MEWRGLNDVFFPSGKREIVWAMFFEKGPLRRITEIPPKPKCVAGATIVSVAMLMVDEMPYLAGCCEGVRYFC